MKLGIVLPQDITDPIGLRDFVQAIEALGFDHLCFPDHVIGGNPASHALNGPYTHESFFHEPIATMGFAAGIAPKLELIPTVIVLPQRQTALLAKQMTQIDLMTGGRTRLGIGVGWNQVEYDVLGMDFGTRGRRIDEQIAVLRLLWSQNLVHFDGEWHQIRDAGINPRPARGTIPIWMGGWSDPMIRRIARAGDGWLLYAPLEEGRICIDKLHAACAGVGRDPAEIGIQSWIFLNKSDVMAGANQKADAHQLRAPEEWRREAIAWREAGATHMDCWTMYGCLTRPDQHIDLARRFKEAMDGL